MIERCLKISSLSTLRIWVGMIFDSIAFLDLKLEIISIVSSFVQSEIKNESWLYGGICSKNIFSESGTSD